MENTTVPVNDVFSIANVDSDKLIGGGILLIGITFLIDTIMRSGYELNIHKGDFRLALTKFREDEPDVIVDSYTV